MDPLAIIIGTVVGVVVLAIEIVSRIRLFRLLREYERRRHNFLHNKRGGYD